MIRRQPQLVGHCGPCSVVMMLGELGYECTQERLSTAAGVSTTIALEGSRLDQLRSGVLQVSQNVDLLLRYRCDLQVLRDVLALGLSVGVEWQCTFQDPSRGLFSTGHFAVVVGISDDKVELVDPDDNSIYCAGSIAQADFLSRWWEDNTFDGGEIVRSFGAAFVLVHGGDSRLRSLVHWGFKPATYDYVRVGGSP